MPFSELSKGIIYCGCAPTKPLLNNQVEKAFVSILDNISCDTVILITSSNETRHSYRMFPVTVVSTLFGKQSRDDSINLINQGFKVEVVTVPKKDNQPPSIEIFSFAEFLKVNALRLVYANNNQESP